MAIDKARTHELTGTIHDLFDEVAAKLPEGTREWLRDRILGAAIKELQALISESRPPVLYLLGRSGHGKSSLLNALAGREVAKVGHVRPQTPGADPHLITFQEVFAEWMVVDARGIFETPVKGTEGPDPVEQAKEEPDDVAQTIPSHGVPPQPGTASHLRYSRRPPSARAPGCPGSPPRRRRSPARWAPLSKRSASSADGLALPPPQA